MLMQFLGYAASFLFVSATAAQAIKTYQIGRADDISHLLLWKLMVGFVLMVCYVIKSVGFDLVLLSSFILQAVAWAVVIKYKYFPRSTEK